MLVIFSESARTCSIHFFMSFWFGLFEGTDIDFSHFLGCVRVMVYVFFIVILKVAERVEVAHIQQTSAADFNTINIQLKNVCLDMLKIRKNGNQLYNRYNSLLKERNNAAI